MIIKSIRKKNWINLDSFSITEYYGLRFDLIL